MIAGNDIGFSFLKIFSSVNTKRTTYEQQPYIHPQPCKPDKNCLPGRIRYEPGDHGGNKNDKECKNECYDCPKSKHTTEYFFNYFHLNSSFIISSRSDQFRLQQDIHLL